MRYDTVFLDVDGTLLWVDLDVEGYVRDLAPYDASSDGGLTVEKATKPVWRSLRRHIRGNIEHRTEEGLADFKRRNAEETARELGVEAPAEVLAAASDRRTSFVPYPESEGVLHGLKETGAALHVVSNWDILLVEVLEGLGWAGYFDGVVASAVVGVEKPETGIYEEALRASGARPNRTVMVGNDPVTDVKGAYEAGLDTVFVDRKGFGALPEATFTVPDLSTLPGIVRG